MILLSVFLIQFVLISLTFFIVGTFIQNPVYTNGVAAVISLIITLCLAWLFQRSKFSSTRLHAQIRDLIEEKKKSEQIRADEIALANKKVNQLAERVSNIANNLGQTSGYMDLLTNQTETNVNEIAVAFSQVVDGTIQESDSIQMVADQISQMTMAINGIARGAQDQAKSVENATHASINVNKAIEEIANKANLAAEASAQAAKAANEGGNTIKETVTAINNIRIKVGESADKVREMGSRSEEIGVIVEKIKNIAAETNLLALNAAIEAARAGEMGRGFAVVASEVRKLAENSVIATKEVNTLVDSIQTSAKEAVITMNLGVIEVEKGVELANHSGKALDGIISTANIVSQGLTDVVKIANQQLDLSNDLGSAMESVSAVVEENTATTEEMAATADDISQETKNVSKVSHENRTTAIGVSRLTDEIKNLVTDSTASAQTLAEMASSLQNLVGEFNSGSEEIIPIQKVLRSANKPTIGVIVPNNNRFWSNAMNFAQIGAEELGVNLILKESQNQKELMEQKLNQLISQNVDGLLWVPYFGLCRKGLSLAREHDIPVVLVDSYQGGIQPKSEEFQNYVAFVGPADETGAYEMGKYLLNHISPATDGKKYIAALDGPQGASASILRHKGLVRAIKEHPEAMLITSLDSDYAYELARKNFCEMLTKYPMIQGVWAANDLMAQGAIDAAKEMKRVPGKDIFVAGMALDQKSIAAIRDGEQLFDIGGHWLQLGFGLSILFDHINGYPIPKGRSIIKIPLLPLTRDKVDQYEKDFPNGIPKYNFRQQSRTYNPKAPISFFEMKYSSN